MKIRFRWMVGTVAGCCWLAALCSLAVVQQPQQAHPHRGAIQVPFDFYVGPSKLPAGQYILEAIAPSYGTVRSSDGKNQVQVYFVQTGQPVKNPRVIFVLRDGNYLFAQVWAWFGKTQYTGFTPQPKDKNKEIPITPAENGGGPSQ